MYLPCHAGSRVTRTRSHFPKCQFSASFCAMPVQVPPLHQPHDHVFNYHVLFHIAPRAQVPALQRPRPAAADAARPLRRVGQRICALLPRDWPRHSIHLGPDRPRVGGVLLGCAGPLDSHGCLRGSLRPAPAVRGGAESSIHYHLPLLSEP
jgi:hypothetical protein